MRSGCAASKRADGTRSGFRSACAAWGDGNGKRPPRMVSTSADELEEAFMRRKRRELEQARMAGAGDTPQVQQVVRGRKKLGEMIRVPAGQGRSTRSATGPKRFSGCPTLLAVFARGWGFLILWSSLEKSKSPPSHSKNRREKGGAPVFIF